LIFSERLVLFYAGDWMLLANTCSWNVKESLHELKTNNTTLRYQ